MAAGAVPWSGVLLMARDLHSRGTHTLRCQHSADSSSEMSEPDQPGLASVRASGLC
jgi:hypothetical protein